MAKGFFITGTDTGVGKTIISAAFIKAALFLGRKVCGMKPVESGCTRDGDALVPRDGMFLREMSHVDEPIDLITPCRFENPLAPMAASQIERKDADIAGIRSSFSRLSEKYDTVIVEGIGGLMVPIMKDYFVVDLAQELGLPLIVVSRPGLGTINHILLTVDCAAKAGLDVAGIVLNYAGRPENDAAEKTNPGLLAQVCRIPLIGTFPHLDNAGEEAIDKTAIETLDLDRIRKYL